MEPAACLVVQRFTQSMRLEHFSMEQETRPTQSTPAEEAEKKRAATKVFYSTYFSFSFFNEFLKQLLCVYGTLSID